MIERVSRVVSPITPGAGVPAGVRGESVRAGASPGANARAVDRTRVSDPTSDAAARQGAASRDLTRAIPAIPVRSIPYGAVPIGATRVRPAPEDSAETPGVDPRSRRPRPDATRQIAGRGAVRRDPTDSKPRRNDGAPGALSGPLAPASTPRDGLAGIEALAGEIRVASRLSSGGKNAAAGPRATALRLYESQMTQASRIPLGGRLDRVVD